MWELNLLILLGLILVFWHRHRGVSDAALQITARALQQQNLQLIDQSLRFRGYRLRSPDGHWQLTRLFSFEYSADRMHKYPGWIHMRGTQRTVITLQQADGFQQFLS